MPLRVNLHDRRPTKTVAIAIVTTKDEEEKIVLEDAVMDIAQISWPLVLSEG